jgi:hypothetical protein
MAGLLGWLAELRNSAVDGQLIPRSRTLQWNPAQNAGQIMCGRLSRAVRFLSANSQYLRRKSRTGLETRPHMKENYAAIPGSIRGFVSFAAKEQK